jgi:hypothetical protein
MWDNPDWGSGILSVAHLTRFSIKDGSAPQTSPQASGLDKPASSYASWIARSGDPRGIPEDRRLEIRCP